MSELLNLGGSWRLCYAPEECLQPQTPREVLDAGWQEVEALVPGNVELDLVRAGLVQDPFYGANCYDFRKYEFYNWWFFKTFIVPPYAGDSGLYLRFEGIDTYADIWLDDQLVAKTANMLISHDVDITSIAEPGQKMTLAVHIHSTVNRARQEPFPVGIASWSPWGQEMAVVRKPPHSFGWDISARLLSAGLWKEVCLVEKPPERLTEVYYYTLSAGAGRAELGVRYRFCSNRASLAGYTVEVDGKCGTQVFHHEGAAWFTGGHLEFTVENPQLWWPRGYGAPALYEMVFTLKRDGQVVDTRTERFGIRTVQVVRDYSGTDQGEFLVKVNGTPVLVKGTNWVFLDCLHSRDAERLTRAHEAMVDLNCNTVRLWGGNVYESDRFYDLCDETGILVWQDFCFACCVYPQHQAFFDEVEREAAQVLIRLRNHPCMFVWSADNEVDAMYFERRQTLPHARYNAISREVLPRAVAMHDPYRDYIPSSPYVPEERDSIFDVPEQHTWGNRDYFKCDFYKNSTSHFTGEIGYPGSPSVSSIKRFLPPEELSVACSHSEAWTAHSTDYLPAGRRPFDRIALVVRHVEVLFGSVPEDFGDFVLASQISQAEAFKYFIERTRLKKWRTTGILWWNLLEGWPQFSEALVDYYFEKKIAYHYVRRVQQPICLIMDEPAEWEYPLVISNDSNTDAMVRYCVKDGESGEIYAEGEVLSRANENNQLMALTAVTGQKKLFLLEWEIGGQRFGNHYTAGYAPMDLAQYRRWLAEIERLERPFSAEQCCK